MLRHGLSMRAVAERRGISCDAVKFHVANAVGKLGLSGLRALRRWQGVAAHSALKGRAAGMTESLTLGAIGEVSRSVSDIEAAAAWYRDVLGVTHLFTTGPLAFFDCGGTRLFLEQGTVTHESVLYFRVEDIHAAHEALVARGATSVAVPHMIHRHANGMEEWMAFFTDPEAPLVAQPYGRAIGIMAQIMPAA